MPQTYAANLRAYLPPQYLELITEAGNKASQLGFAVFLVGGVVRDLLLTRPGFDLDLVVEGDAIRLATELAKDGNARLVTHPRFGTATVRLSDLTIDLATTRSEVYRYPGALPEVHVGGTISDDLYRRDFTVNAMALYVTPSRYGELVDPFGGNEDLNNKLIRILHPASFADDATRIFRAIRYEQRLNFSIEKQTLELLQNAISMINTISSDRVRHELELILKENQPEKTLMRCGDLGLLHMLYPGLKADAWLTEKFSLCRLLFSSSPLLLLYLSLLIYRLDKTELDQFLARYHFPSMSSLSMTQTVELKHQLHLLATNKCKASDIYQLLHTFNVHAIEANLVATYSSSIREKLELYLSRLRTVKPLLSGHDLQKLGVRDGKTIGDTITRLRHAKLNGEVSTRQQEEQLVKSWFDLH